MARTGMTALIEELRGMCEAGTAEYTLGTTVYWSDNTLQSILDRHRSDYVFEMLQTNPAMGTAGALVYYDYYAPVGNWETTSGGTAIFYIQDGAGSVAGTSLWTADYRLGLLTFGTDTAGSTLYLTGRAYDLNSSAAEVWRMKAAHYAPNAFDFSTDNHSVSRQQVYAHCMEMANFFNGQSSDSIQTVSLYRSDLNDSD